MNRKCCYETNEMLLSQRWTCHKTITRSNSWRWRPYSLETISHVDLHHLPNLLVTNVDEILEVLAELNIECKKNYKWYFKNKGNLTIFKIILLQVSSFDNCNCNFEIHYISNISLIDKKNCFVSFSFLLNDSHNEIIFGKIYKILFLALL